ncbi:MAG: glutamate-1-semialdehyde 2,1-aminomutase, partial [Methanomassiliicoccales archaeon]
FPSVDMIRLVNSGTEATMHAIRLARGHTGRDKVLKIEGAFHGAHDSMLVRAGSGATTHAAPDSLGVPNDFTRHTLLAPFNDLEAAEALVREHREDLAAVILEPVIGNAGPIPPEEGYLEGLKEVTEENDVLLIFDEVITGFRLSMGGAQELYGVRPDLTVLGKVAGGGLPIGIFAGPEEIMSKVSPTGKVYQAGTFSGNPLTLAAGLCALRKLRRLGHEELNEKGRRMLSTLGEAVGDLPLTPQGIGSMFQLFFRDSPVGDHEGAKGCDTSLYDRVFQGMMDRGVYLPPAQFETGFLSTAHSDKDIDRAGEAMAETLQEVMG